MYIKKFIKLSAIIFIVYCLIVHSHQIRNSVIDSMEVWAKIIIPSVFPYLILSQYISSENGKSKTSKPRFMMARKIFNISPCSLKVLICGMLCGYPAGAICASALYKDGYISEKEAVHLIGFTNNAGPLFLISAIGTSMLGNTADGVAIYIIQLISALIYGAITARSIPAPSYTTRNALHTEFDFCEAVRKSVVTTVNICGFMIVAYILSECVMIFLSLLFPDNVSDSIYINCLCNVFFEISSGVKELCLLNATPATFGFICSAVSWSGFSVILQIKSAAKNIVNMRSIIIAKLCQGIISFIIAYMYKLKFPELVCYDFTGVSLEISIAVCVVVFIVYIIGRYCKRVKL